jgi:hypothetical protein
MLPAANRLLAAVATPFFSGICVSAAAAAVYSSLQPVQGGLLRHLPCLPALLLLLLLLL